MKYIFVDNKVDFFKGLYYVDYAYLDDNNETQTKYECFETHEEATARYKQIDEIVASSQSWLPC
jgi:hypothetical protein